MGRGKYDLEQRGLVDILSNLRFDTQEHAALSYKIGSIIGAIRVAARAGNVKLVDELTRQLDTVIDAIKREP